MAGNSTTNDEWREVKQQLAMRLADTLNVRIAQKRGESPRIKSSLYWNAPWGREVDMIIRQKVRVDSKGKPHCLLYSYGDVLLYVTCDHNEVVLLVLDGSKLNPDELSAAIENPEDEWYLMANIFRPGLVATFTQRGKDGWVRQT